MPGNVTLSIKLAESAAACSLLNHLQRRYIIVSEGCEHQRALQGDKAHLRESVVKFWTGTDSPSSGRQEKQLQQLVPTDRNICARE